MPDEIRAQLLHAVVGTPGLTDRERSLMREIAHKYSMDQHYNWTPAEEDEVAALFGKIHVQLS